MHEMAKVPRYAHSGEYGDLAADLCSVEDITLETGDVRVIPTGIAMEFPAEYGGLIADRSGLAVRGIGTPFRHEASNDCSTTSHVLT